MASCWTCHDCEARSSAESVLLRLVLKVHSLEVNVENVQISKCYEHFFNSGYMWVTQQAVLKRTRRDVSTNMHWALQERQRLATFRCATNHFFWILVHWLAWSVALRVSGYTKDSVKPELWSPQVLRVRRWTWPVSRRLPRNKATACLRTAYPFMCIMSPAESTER